MLHCFFEDVQVLLLGLVPDVMGWQISRPDDVVNVRVRGRYVLHHVVNCALWSVAFPVVSPLSCSGFCVGRPATGQSAAQGFIAVSIGTLLIPRVIVSIGQVEHLE